MKVVNFAGKTLSLDGSVVIDDVYKIPYQSKEKAQSIFDDIASRIVIKRSTPVHVVSGWLIEIGAEDSVAMIYEASGEIFKVSPVDGGYLLTKNGEEVGTFRNIRSVSGEIIRLSSQI